MCSGPCKVIAPTFEKLSKEYPNVNFVKVDVDEAQEVAQKYSVTFVYPQANRASTDMNLQSDANIRAHQRLVIMHQLMPALILNVSCRLRRCTLHPWRSKQVRAPHCYIYRFMLMFFSALISSVAKYSSGSTSSAAFQGQGHTLGGSNTTGKPAVADPRGLLNISSEIKTIAFMVIAYLFLMFFMS